MTGTAPAPATKTTLRVPPRVFLIGRSYKDAAELMQLLIVEGYMPIADLKLDDALTKLRSAKFEFVLLDIDVAGAAAQKFIETLRGDEQLAGIPVLVISPSNDMEAIERSLAAGADDYLPGLFGAAVLRLRVNAALDRRRIQDGQYLRREISTARTIQRDFLPETLPEVADLELEAALRPARDVSGDFYDCFLLTSGEVILVVGDVCDKGVGAALFMALFRSLIRASADPVGGGAIQMFGGRHTMMMQAIQSDSPGELLTRVAGFTNDYIARLHGRTNMFATVFLASLEPNSGEFAYVNAGHEPALIISPDGSMEELRPTGPALGMMPDSHFKAVTRTLERGHSFFAFTDGLVEAHSPTGEIYGSERLREVVRANSNGSPSALVRGVLDALETFARHGDPHDDVTMLAARLVSSDE
ncbi:MAG TPA: SpoIIE family protein phosphatase [Gemmatimonadaceae bacterium]|nr:SpoIIE family protein phosphatase [Gemmatimonadaceae bacterium]